MGPIPYQDYLIFDYGIHIEHIFYIPFLINLMTKSSTYQHAQHRLKLFL